MILVAHLRGHLWLDCLTTPESEISWLLLDLPGPDLHGGEGVPRPHRHSRRQDRKLICKRTTTLALPKRYCASTPRPGEVLEVFIRARAGAKVKPVSSSRAASPRGSFTVILPGGSRKRTKKNNREIKQTRLHPNRRKKRRKKNGRGSRLGLPGILELNESRLSPPLCGIDLQDS